MIDGTEKVEFQLLILMEEDIPRPCYQSRVTRLRWCWSMVTRLWPWPHPPPAPGTVWSLLTTRVMTSSWCWQPELSTLSTLSRSTQWPASTTTKTSGTTTSVKLLFKTVCHQVSSEGGEEQNIPVPCSLLSLAGRGDDQWVWSGVMVCSSWAVSSGDISQCHVTTLCHQVRNVIWSVIW